MSDIKNSDEKYNKQVKDLKEFIGKPVFLVAYRTSSSIKEIKQKSVADGIYIFSKSTGTKYPDYVEDFETKFVIKGELKRLVDDVKKHLRR